MDSITIPKATNGHGHPRQDELFEYLIRIMMHIFHHYLGMGNTKPPLLNADDATRYQRHGHNVRDAKNPDAEFELHSVIKLREDTLPATVREAIGRGFRFFKLYPKSKTTHADDGISNYMHPNLRGCYEVIATEKSPDGKKAHSLWHNEHPRKLWDDSECEYAALGAFEQVYNLVPGLNMTWCHLSDTRVVPTLMDMEDRVVFELAVHYGYLRENDTHGKNHYVSRPPAKLLRDMQEIRRLMVSGHPKTINGLDDAIWPKGFKECADGMCGIWNLIEALPRIIQIFEEEGALGPEGTPKYTNLVNFLSGNALRHYELSPPKSTLTLVRQPHQVPNEYTLGSTVAVPFGAGKPSLWSFKDFPDFQALAQP